MTAEEAGEVVQSQAGDGRTPDSRLVNSGELLRLCNHWSPMLISVLARSRGGSEKRDL